MHEFQSKSGGRVPPVEKVGGRRPPAFPPHYTKALESLQRRALCIIYEDGDYMLSLSRAGFDTLEERREQLTERFFRRSALPETSCLHYLLPSKLDVSVTSRLRHARTLEHLKCRTVKFRHSFFCNLQCTLFVTNPADWLPYQ